MVKCLKCNTDNSDDAIHCIRCGMRLIPTEQMELGNYRNRTSESVPFGWKLLIIIPIVMAVLLGVLSFFGAELFIALTLVAIPVVLIVLAIYIWKALSK